MNNIYIIGAGAVGKVLAVSLKLSGRNVSIIRGSIDEGFVHTEKIQIVLADKTELTAEVEISSLSRFPVLDGIIVLTNKSYGNENLAQALKDKTGRSPLVVLQNGLGVERPFIENGFSEIYRCVLFMTSQMLSEYRISFKPVSVSPIGIIKGSKDNLKNIVESMNSHRFGFRTETDINSVIWKKAIINSVFNSICPLLDVDNGIFHRDQGVLEIAKRVIEECTEIAGESGIFLKSEEVLENLLLISKSSDGQLISTLQDIKNKRKTEIETLNFEIAGIAKELNLEDRVKETKLLGELTRLKSELSRGN